MMASLEVGDKRFFLEYGLKVRKVRKTYRNGRYRVVLEKEKLEGLEIWGGLRIRGDCYGSIEAR